MIVDNFWLEEFSSPEELFTQKEPESPISNTFYSRIPDISCQVVEHKQLKATFRSDSNKGGTLEVARAPDMGGVKERIKLFKSKGGVDIKRKVLKGK